MKKLINYEFYRNSDGSARLSCFDNSDKIFLITFWSYEDLPKKMKQETINKYGLERCYDKTDFHYMDK